MTNLKQLEQLGITRDAILTNDKPEFDKITAKELKTEKGYKGAAVDRVINAFYQDVKSFITDGESLLEELASLRRQYDDLESYADTLRVDIENSRAADEKVNQFELLMDTMEAKLRESVENRARDLEQLGQLKEERDLAVERIEELKAQAREIERLTQELHSAESAVQELSQTIGAHQESQYQLQVSNQELVDQLNYYDEQYYKLERDINFVVKSLRETLASHGVQFQVMQEDEVKSDDIDFTGSEGFDDELTHDFGADLEDEDAF